MTHLKDVSRLKGAICGNPALQGGGSIRHKMSRLEDGTSGLDAFLAGVPWPRHQHNSQLPPSRRVPSFRRPVLTHSLPALKGGVTITFAFQAS
ncbi:MAG: hypothetical protein J6W23_11500 [Victivallales bacterium]|nr:hypothetical protein [Victivallales bacterium]MBO7535392.1 hypothetical protein [Victivallales bacterium]